MTRGKSRSIRRACFGWQGIEEKQIMKTEEKGASEKPIKNLEFPLVLKDKFDFLTKCHIEVLAKKSTDVVIEKFNQKIDKAFEDIIK